MNSSAATLHQQLNSQVFKLIQIFIVEEKARKP